MNWDIRVMRNEDLPAVVDAECIALQIGKNKARNPVFFDMAFRNNPGGCFVGVSDGCVVGFVMSLITGAAGWIGSIEIAASHDGNGMKAALLNAALNNLLAKSTVTAIQVPADDYAFIEMCVMHGFQLVEPQVILSGSTAEISRSLSESTASRVEWQDMFGVTAIGELMSELHIGREIILKSDEKAAGRVVVEIQPRRLNSGTSSCAVSFGGVTRSLSAQPLRSALALAGSAAGEIGAESLYVTLNGWYQTELTMLCGSGWKIRKIAQRLIHKKTVARYKQLLALPQVELSHWSL